ncbi:MAG: PIG-L family deacetylase [Anaerolineae bacterium]
MTGELSLLAVFAHPDDESLGIGGTLARYAAEGVKVSLICATRGEEGEINDPSLGTKEQLAEIRERELRCACDLLGITELHFLGYRDSGMAGTPANDDPRSLVRAAPYEAEGKIVHLMRQIRPQVVVTFDESGGYGHPDHKAIHRHTKAAFCAAGDPTQYPEHLAEGLEPYAPQRLYYTAFPRSVLQKLIQKVKEMGLEHPFGEIDLESVGVPDEYCTTHVDVSAYLEVKEQARQCHRSQLAPDNLFTLIPAEVRRQFMHTDCFACEGMMLEKGECPADDLFAGLR